MRNLNMLFIGAIAGFIPGFLFSLDNFAQSWIVIIENNYIKQHMFGIILTNLRPLISQWLVWSIAGAIFLFAADRIMSTREHQARFLSISKMQENVIYRGFRSAGLLLCIIYGGFFIVFAAHSSHTAMTAHNKPNVILIAVDTLRADHLSSYGYSRNTTPSIDRLAKEGLQYTQCISHIPVTTPSFATIFTSQRPISHGILDNFHRGYRLNDRILTLAEIFKNQGYQTAGFVSGLPLKRGSNLDQGFDLYEDEFEKSRIAETVNKSCFQWLKDNGDNKFFLFLHYYDPHGKYEPPFPYNQMFDYTVDKQAAKNIPKYQMHSGIADPSYYEAQYDGEIAYTDNHIGLMLKKLGELDRLENTLIVFTSDHGETMAEHLWWFDHGCFVYEEQIHVPLIFWYPGKLEAARIGKLVSLVDIFPTVLEIAGVRVPTEIEGTSLLEAFYNGESWRKKSVISETARGDSLRNKNTIDGLEGKQFSIRTETWKLILTPKTSGVEYELYNIKKDPMESNNLQGELPEVEEALKVQLNRFRNEYVKKSQYRNHLGASSNIKLSPQMVEKLKELGYVQ